MADVFAGLAGLKSAFDLLKAASNARDQVRVDAAVHELWEKINTIREQYLSAADEVRELKGQLSRFENWETQKQRYQLKRYEPGVFIYTLKPAMAGDEPPHHICPGCYEERKRSFLHSGGQEEGTETFSCHGCGAKFVIGTYHGYESGGSEAI